MGSKISVLALATALTIFGTGCHAPLKRAAKTAATATDQNAKKPATCDMQGALTAALKAKHSNLLNLVVGQMRPVSVAGADINHMVATFDVPPAAPTAAQTTPTAPTTPPASGTSPGTGDSTDDSSNKTSDADSQKQTLASEDQPDGTSTGQTTDQPTTPPASPPATGDQPAPVNPSAPQGPSTPPAATNPSQNQSMVASVYVDPIACNVTGYVEAPVISKLDSNIPSCDEDDAIKLMGQDAATKRFAILKYDDSFKSPYEAMMGIPLSEVYTEGMATDGTTPTLTQYFFSQPSCKVSFPEKVSLAAPVVASPKTKKSGS